MSVRRLADEAVQPTSFAFTAENDNWAAKLIGRYPTGRQQSAVIPLLMRAQEQDGWVTRAAIEHVADRLAMPLIRVLEVATFYTQFQLKPVGTKAHIQVCGTTPCMLRGAEALKDVCRSKIHREQQHLNESGTLSWEEVECLGACVNAPMVMVFKDTYEDLTPERLAEIIDAFERGEAVKPGPQIDRHLSVPVGGLTTLTSFEDDEDIGERDATSAAGSGAARGRGADAASPAPSQAARVDTHAAETDPSIKSPADKVGADVDPAVEEAASADPDAGAGPGAGRAGGTRQGATDAAEKEAQAEDATVGEAAARKARASGAELPSEEGAAEDAVVADKFQPEDGGGAQKRRGARTAGASGRPEGARTATEDTGTADPTAAAPAGRRKSTKKTDEPDGSQGA